MNRVDTADRVRAAILEHTAPTRTYVVGALVKQRTDAYAHWHLWMHRIVSESTSHARADACVAIEQIGLEVGEMMAMEIEP